MEKEDKSLVLKRQMEFEGQDTKKRKLCRGKKISEIHIIDLLSLWTNATYAQVRLHKVWQRTATGSWELGGDIRDGTGLVNAGTPTCQRGETALNVLGIQLRPQKSHALN